MKSNVTNVYGSGNPQNLVTWRDFIKNVNNTITFKMFPGTGRRQLQTHLYRLIKINSISQSELIDILNNLDCSKLYKLVKETGEEYGKIIFDLVLDYLNLSKDTEYTKEKKEKKTSKVKTKKSSSAKPIIVPKAIPRPMTKFNPVPKSSKIDISDITKSSSKYKFPANEIPKLITPAEYAAERLKKKFIENEPKKKKKVSPDIEYLVEKLGKTSPRKKKESFDIEYLVEKLGKTSPRKIKDKLKDVELKVEGNNALQMLRDGNITNKDFKVIRETTDNPALQAATLIELYEARNPGKDIKDLKIDIKNLAMIVAFTGLEDEKEVEKEVKKEVKKEESKQLNPKNRHQLKLIEKKITYEDMKKIKDSLKYENYKDNPSRMYRHRINLLEELVKERTNKELDMNSRTINAIFREAIE